MSLHALADHMASKGRNGDTMLVHMTPGEVAGLHALALAHGGKLTTNPDTGLPEANFLKKLLPMIAGMALNFIAPGIGSAIGSALGTSAAVGTGIAVGGITGLATGSLKKGLMAGLGAYGGASLGAGLFGAESAGAAAFGGAEAGAVAENLASQGVTGAGADALVQDAAKTAMSDYAAKPFMEQVSGSFGALKDAGGLGSLARPAMFAATPMLADQGVQTTTKMPETQGYLRPYVYDPYSQGLTALTPVAHKDAYAPPTGGRAGGLMSLAGGGAVAFADGGDTTKNIQEWWKANEGKGDQAALDKWLATSGYSAAEIAKALPQFSVTDLNSAIASALTRQQVADRQETRGLYQAAHEKLFPGTDPGFVVTPHVDDPRNAYSKAILEEVQRMTAGQPAKTYGTTSAVPQEEIEAYKARLREKDPNLAEFMEWRLGEMDPMQHQRIGTLMAGKNPYDLDENQIAQFKATMERATQRAGGTPEWLQADWRKTQAARNAAYDAEQERRRKEAAGSGFVVGGTAPSGTTGTGTTGTGTTGTGTTGTGTTGTGTVLRDTGVSTTRPFDFAQTPISRMPVITQQKPEDVMSGESLNAYLALMGKGSTATRQWKEGESPGRAYLPASSQSPFFIQRDSKVATPTGVQTTTPITTTGAVDITNKNAYPSEPAGPGMEWYWDGSKWAKRPSTDIGGTAGDTAAGGGLMSGYAGGGYALGGLGSLGGYSDGGRLLRGPGDGVSDSIPATIGDRRPARLADGEFVVPARIVSELGNGSTEAGARKLYAMMDRVQRARGKTTGKRRVAVNSRADKYLPA